MRINQTVLKYTKLCTNTTKYTKHYENKLKYNKILKYINIPKYSKYYKIH